MFSVEPFNDDVVAHRLAVAKIVSARLICARTLKVGAATTGSPITNLQPHLMMTRPQLKKPSPAQLEELIDEATIDCFGEDEEHTGLLTMIEEYVVCPFRAKVIGESVEVSL